MKYSIRRSVESDFEQMFDIWMYNQNLTLGKFNLLSDVELLKADLYHSMTQIWGARFYVAEHESKQIVGWQSLIPMPVNPIVRNLMVISSTNIDHEFMNAHEGSQLFDWAFRDAKNIGVEHIYA